MTFGPTKCHVIHVGHNANKCLKQKAHEHILDNVNHATYLGDCLHSTGSIDRTIDSRRQQGLSAITQISSLVEQISLGRYFFEILIIFRNSVLVSKLIFNSEVWNVITESQYNKLQDIDELYIRRVMNVMKSVAKESIYITLGILPLKYLIKIRRLMYWWH